MRNTHSASPRLGSGERLGILEQRLSDHETRCEERLAEIRSTAANTLKAVEGLRGRFWSITLALLAWAMAQVWAGSQARVAHLEGKPTDPIAQEVADVAAR